MSDDGNATGSYREDDLLTRLRDILETTDSSLDELTRSDLATVEEFHLGGRAATRELAELANLQGDRVLDVGCAVGGPARTLAAEYDCEVVGLDRVAAYPRVARWLSARVGPDRVGFVRGDATALPVTEGAVDAAWLQHAGMNVAEKDRLFAGLFGAVEPGGRLAVHEVCAGEGSPRFPVPWATDSADSYLLVPGDLRRGIEDAGFECGSWTDVTDESVEQVRAALAARDRGSAGPSVVDLLVDAKPDAVFENLAANLRSGRVSVVMGVFERPAAPD